MQRHPTSHHDSASPAFLRKKIRTGEEMVDATHVDSSRSIFGPSEPAEDETAYSDADFAPQASGEATTPANLADENVAPFLARHNPEQYAPLGSYPFDISEPVRANSKYCYRHRPDIKCRRQADEPSMDHLQRVRFSFSHAT